MCWLKITAESLTQSMKLGLCLLSLDGGGVRGLSTLYILKGLMTRLNHERQQKSLPVVKPCEVFDLMGGTSTGGHV
jgi:patatin-like phospholipase/acyl hydrolase